MMIDKSDKTTKLALVAIAVFLGIIALRPFVEPTVTVMAQPARFDHVMIASTGFLYKGAQGMLTLDKRNGNVWFFPRGNEGFQDPIFVMRMEFEKIDRAPTQQ
jgi:hypothetical protein